MNRRLAGRVGWAGYTVAGALLLGGAAPGTPVPGTPVPGAPVPAAPGLAAPGRGARLGAPGKGTDGPGGGPWWSVVAEGAGGAVVAARPLPADGTFALAYEHSAYHAPTVEVFAAAGGRFTMYAVASPNEAVLDYYAVAGSRSASAVSGWWALRPDRPQTFEELSLIATPIGRRTLVAGLDCVPLYPPAGASDLRIRIAAGPPAGRTAGGAERCPPGVAATVRSVFSR